jgi:hypothetical protein
LLSVIEDLYFDSRISIGTSTPTQGDATVARRGRTIAAFLISPLTPAIALTPILMLGNGALFGLALGFYALAVNAVVAYRSRSSSASRSICWLDGGVGPD